MRFCLRGEADLVTYAAQEALRPAVMSLAEAPVHPHLVARETFVEVEGVPQPAPAPRFSRTPGSISRPPAEPGEHTDEVLTDWGFDAERLAALHASGAIS